MQKSTFGGLGRTRFLHASVSEPEFEPTLSGRQPIAGGEAATLRNPRRDCEIIGAPRHSRGPTERSHIK